jgi:hypothetical protein
MPVLTFTSAIYRALKRDPEMPETCKLWRADGTTAEEQAIAFADELREDIENLLRSVAVGFGPDEVETQLLLNIADQVISHVAWSRISRALLKDFAPADQDGYHFSAPSLLPSVN